MRLDETMLVKQLLPEICHFIHTYREGNQHAAELRSSASGVLFSLSCNNFNAVFSRISTRYWLLQHPWGGTASALLPAASATGCGLLTGANALNALQ